MGSLLLLLLLLLETLGKGGYVFGRVGLFVCLSVCLWTLLKGYERIRILWRGPG